MLPCILTAEKQLVEDLSTRCPQTLLTMKENAYVIKSAALRAVQSLIESGLSVITPVVLLISRTAALGASLNGVQIIIVNACLASVFIGGSAILAYDHKKKEKLSKLETELGEQARMLMTSIATIVINGGAKSLPPWMLSIKKGQSIPATRHDVVMALLYGTLEIATTGIPVVLVWILKGPTPFLPLYIIIQPMFWNSWYLFWTIKSLVISTAPWCQYAEFMAGNAQAISVPVQELKPPESPQEMVPAFNCPNTNEIELTGPSGCGKTTLMRRIIAEISTKFMLGYMLYIDQFACVPTGITIREYYASAFSPDRGTGSDEIENDLLRWAKELCIDNVINTDTLDRPFFNMSGGERKRIIFLKYTLPILMGVSNVMIAFLDEVSAGLDLESFSKVRAIIEAIKSKGVKVISIDHHEHTGDKIKKVTVLKRVIHNQTNANNRMSLSLSTSSSPLSFWQSIISKIKIKRVTSTASFSTSTPYYNADADIEPDDNSTEIIVWDSENLFIV
jgi:Fe-S cluster assembly ATPase SufC